MNTITIPIKTLREVLRGFRFIKKTSNAVSKLVHITTGPEGTTFTATDLDQYLKYQLSANYRDAFEVVIIPLKVLQDAQRQRAISGMVTLDVDNSMVEVEENGRYSHFTFTPVEEEDFPPLPAHAPLKEYLDTEQVRALLDTAGFVSKDPTREVLQSVYLDQENIVGTDGKQLCHHWVNPMEIEQPVQIPGASFLRNLSSTKGLWISTSNEAGWSALWQDRWTWIYRRPVVSFPNWKAVIPAYTESGARFLLSKKDVDLLLRHIAKLPFVRESKGVVTMLVNKDRVGIRFDQANAQWQELEPEEITLDDDNKVYHLTVDFNLWHNALALGIRSFHIRDELTPLIGYAEKMITVTMPMRSDQTPVMPEKLTEKKVQVCHG